MQWSDKIQAAFLLSCKGGHSQKEIAAQLGISDRTLRNWARISEWKARETEAHEAWEAEWRIKMKVQRRDNLVKLETYLDTEIAALQLRTTTKRERLLHDTVATYHPK